MGNEITAGKQQYQITEPEKNSCMINNNYITIQNNYIEDPYFDARKQVHNTSARNRNELSNLKQSKLDYPSMTQQTLNQNHRLTSQPEYISPSPGTFGSRIYMQNILSVYNEQSKEILKVRVNPVMTIGGLKQRIAQKYKTGQ